MTRRTDPVTRSLLVAASGCLLLGAGLLLVGRRGGVLALALAFLLQLGSLLRRALRRR